MLMVPPASLDSVITRINCIVACLFQWAKAYLLAPLLSRCKQGQQEDHFNSLGKMESLERVEEAGFVLLAKTPGDDTSTPEEIDQMGEVLQEKGCAVTVLENQADAAALPGGDLHLANPLVNPRLQRDIHRVLLA